MRASPFSSRAPLADRAKYLPDLRDINPIAVFAIGLAIVILVEFLFMAG